ncbi:unnamed protein product [Dibothriocephalus latus]|uniref:Cytoplasmic tRNA 2-thiolation protein 1 C-terminal domain-containing protein n=1 Tax=Dibothriocephalus latus TaxID=60516 RepID=A0A3P7P4Q4_DIBLA|nr:unnamed protein product [Dibothriocephalus latus]
MYAHARKLDYFSTECKYAPNAYRHNKLWRADGYPSRNQNANSSQKYCQACVLLKSLNDGLPTTSVGVEGQRTRMVASEIPATDSGPTDMGDNSVCNPDCECLRTH